MHRQSFSFENYTNAATGAIFFAAYVGPSMNPTLREPEIMEIMPYDDRPIRVGDVIFFLPMRGAQPIVHRISRVTSEGMFTLGDNNVQEDSFVLQPKDVKGQVTAAWRGQRRRKIAGGLKGRFIARWFRWLRLLDHRLSPLLHPLYHALAQRGGIAMLLPASFRPRVVVLRAKGQSRFRLLLGRHVIGRCDDRNRQWRIQRPFRLFVNERELERLQNGNGTCFEVGMNKDAEP